MQAICDEPPGLPAAAALRCQTGLLSEGAQALTRQPTGGRSAGRSASAGNAEAVRWPSCVDDISGLPSSPGTQLWAVDLFDCREPGMSSLFGERSAAHIEAERQCERGPTYAARRENFKTQWYVAQLSRSHGSDKMQGGSKGTPAATSKGFAECATAVDSLIEDITRGARQPQRQGPQAQKQSESRDEQLRGQEELQLLRRRQREARNPHSKVQAKLESKRKEFLWLQQHKEVPEQPAMDIPMQKVNFKGGKVSLVDVKSLRARCHQASAVRSLLQRNRSESQHRRLMSVGKSALQTSASLPSLVQAH